MKNYLTAFLLCAWMGIGLHNSPATAAGKGAQPGPDPAPNQQCQDLEKQITAAEEAADAACAADETAEACKSADAAVDALYKQAEDAKCVDGGDSGGGANG